MKRIGIFLAFLITSANVFSQNEFLAFQTNFDFSESNMKSSGVKTAKIYVSSNAFGIFPDAKLAAIVKFNNDGLVTEFNKTSEYKYSFQMNEIGEFDAVKITYSGKNPVKVNYADPQSTPQLQENTFDGNGNILTQKRQDIEDSKDYSSTVFTYENAKLISMISSNYFGGKKPIGVYSSDFEYSSNQKTEIFSSGRKKSKDIYEKHVSKYNSNGKISEKEIYIDFVGDRKNIKLHYIKKFAYDNSGKLIKTERVPNPAITGKYDKAEKIIAKFKYEDSKHPNLVSEVELFRPEMDVTTKIIYKYE